MLTFDTPDGRFTLRVAGVASAGPRVLFHTTKGDGFWSLPGGRVEFGEDAAGALRREMAEEMGAEATVGRLLWTVENHFSYRGRRCHEVSLLFRMSLPADRVPPAGPHEFAGIEDGGYLRFAWIDLSDRARWPGRLKPDFLATRAFRDSLADDGTTRHIVVRDPSES